MWGDYGPGSAGGPGSGIAAADLSFTPKPNDQMVIGGKTYQVVPAKTRSPFSEAAIHLVKVRGGNGEQALAGRTFFDTAQHVMTASTFFFMR